MRVQVHALDAREPREARQRDADPPRARAHLHQPLAGVLVEGDLQQPFEEGIRPGLGSEDGGQQEQLQPLLRGPHRHHHRGEPQGRALGLVTGQLRQLAQLRRRPTHLRSSARASASGRRTRLDGEAPRAALDRSPWRPELSEARLYLSQRQPFQRMTDAIAVSIYRSSFPFTWEILSQTQVSSAQPERTSRRSRTPHEKTAATGLARGVHRHPVPHAAAGAGRKCRRARVLTITCPTSGRTTT